MACASAAITPTAPALGASAAGTSLVVSFGLSQVARSMDRVFRDAVVQSASTPSTPIPPHAVRTTRRRTEFAVRLRLRSRSRQTQHDCSLSDATQRIRNRRLRSARLNEDCFPAPKLGCSDPALAALAAFWRLSSTARSGFRPTPFFVKTGRF
jgi:hypothetical protein